MSNYYTKSQVDNKVQSIDLSAYAKTTDLNNYLTKTDAANTYSSKNDSSNFKMAVANISRSYGSSKTYSFNKSINQYFISGYLINNGPRVFNGAYNNGTNFGWIFEYYQAVGGGVGSANATNVSCSANGITIDSIYNGIDFNLSAVIIYPAIYGNVTIS